MTTPGDSDRLSHLINSINHDVIPYNQTPQISLNFIQEWAAQTRKISQGLNAVEEILHHTPGRDGILLRDEIEDLRNPLDGGAGPDDLVGHLLVAVQEEGTNLFVGDDPTSLDIRQAPVHVFEEL